MPSRGFERWAQAFDRNYQPNTPIQKGGQMSPSLVPLPTRAGTLRFSEEDVMAVIELLTQCAPGQAVRLTEEPDPKDSTARRRVEIMKDQVQSRDGAIPDGFKLRGHVLMDG